jgi:hypothetical protein
LIRLQLCQVPKEPPQPAARSVFRLFHNLARHESSTIGLTAAASQLKNNKTLILILKACGFGEMAIHRPYFQDFCSGKGGEKHCCSNRKTQILSTPFLPEGSQLTMLLPSGQGVFHFLSTLIHTDSHVFSVEKWKNRWIK